MNADDTDRQLRKLYQELRSQDAPDVPAFPPMTRRRQPPRSSAVLWWRWAPAAALVIALGVLLAVLQHGRRSPAAADLQPWTALSNWRASTDELLTVSSTPWGSKITTPTDSWIEDGTVSDSTQTNKKETL